MPGEVLFLTLPIIGPASVGVAPREGVVAFTATAAVGNGKCTVEARAARAFAMAILRAADAADRSAANTVTGA
jgi:hypothetical protein